MFYLNVPFNNFYLFGYIYFSLIYGAIVEFIIIYWAVIAVQAYVTFLKKLFIVIAQFCKNTMQNTLRNLQVI